MALAPHTHDFAPPKLARLLAWLLAGRGAPCSSTQNGAAATAVLPDWLPALAAECELLEGRPEGDLQPRCTFDFCSI